MHAYKVVSGTLSYLLTLTRLYSPRKILSHLELSRGSMVRVSATGGQACMPTNIIPLLVGKVLECGYMPREVKTEKPKYKGVKDKIDTGLEIIRRTDFPMPDKNGQFKPRGKKIAILKWD